MITTHTSVFEYSRVHIGFASIVTMKSVYVTILYLNIKHYLILLYIIRMGGKDRIISSEGGLQDFYHCDFKINI